MKQIGEGYWKNESRYILEYNGVNYIREESEMDGNFHIIKWNITIPDESRREDGPLHYYSNGMGWNDETGHLNKNQPAPDLEIEFKKIRNEKL